MAKETMIVKGIEVAVKRIKEEDYISLTQMLKAKDGEFFITDWLTKLLLSVESRTRVVALATILVV